MASRSAYTRPEAAVILGVTERTLVRWHQEGKHFHPWRDPTDPTGRRWLYDKKEVDNFARRRRRRGSGSYRVGIDRGDPALGDLVTASNVEAIGSLCVAATTAPEAVDAWLTRTSFGSALTYAANVHAQAAALFDEARAVFSELDDEVFDLRNPADACAIGALQMYRFVMARVRLELGQYPFVDNDEAVSATNRILGILALQESEIADGREPDSVGPESR